MVFKVLRHYKSEKGKFLVISHTFLSELKLFWCPSDCVLCSASQNETQTDQKTINTLFHNGERYVKFN